MTRWSKEVQLSRAMLALDDPVGELDAVDPLGRSEALAIIAKLSKRPSRGRSRITSARGKAREQSDAQLAAVLGLPLDRSKGMTFCPAHGDTTPSLSWRWSGRLILHCFAGCEWSDILSAVGMAA